MTSIPTNTEMYCRMVQEFNVTYDIVSYRFFSNVAGNTLKLRATLIDEEHKEYIKAIEDNNKLEMLDGLCDLAYVIAGTMMIFGMWPTPYTSSGKEHPIVSLEPDISFLIDELNKDVPCNKITYAELNRLLIKVDNIGCGNFNMLEAFTAVHQNNMNKVWTLDEIEALSQDRNHYSIKHIKDKFIVKRADGKILKPPGHVKPNLSSFLHK